MTADPRYYGGPKTGIEEEGEKRGEERSHRCGEKRCAWIFTVAVIIYKRNKEGLKRRGNMEFGERRGGIIRSS